MVGGGGGHEAGGVGGSSVGWRYWPWAVLNTWKYHYFRFMLLCTFWLKNLLKRCVLISLIKKFYYFRPFWVRPVENFGSRQPQGWGLINYLHNMLNIPTPQAHFRCCDYNSTVLRFCARRSCTAGAASRIRAVNSYSTCWDSTKDVNTCIGRQQFVPGKSHQMSTITMYYITFDAANY